MKTLLVSLLLCSGIASTQAQGTAFTYQGRLNDGNAPANGVYDLAFSVWSPPVAHPARET